MSSPCPILQDLFEVVLGLGLPKEPPDWLPRSADLRPALHFRNRAQIGPPLPSIGLSDHELKHALSRKPYD